MSSNDRKNEPTSAARGTRHDVDDFSIYIHRDGIRLSAKWKIRAYGDGGALSESDMTNVAEKFDFPKERIRRLSRELGYCLDEESEVNLIEINRSRALERASLALEKAVKRAKNAEHQIERIGSILEGLDNYFAKSATDEGMLERTKALVAVAATSSAELPNALVKLLETDGAAADMSPTSKTKISDGRRRQVVRHCCYTWNAACRHVGVTVVSDASKKGQKHGQLIDFIQMVIGMVTDPSSELSGETIKVDIDHFKETLKNPDGILGPPEFGPKG